MSNFCHDTRTTPRFGKVGWLFATIFARFLALGKNIFSRLSYFRMQKVSPTSYFSSVNTHVLCHCASTSSFTTSVSPDLPSFFQPSSRISWPPNFAIEILLNAALALTATSLVIELAVAPTCTCPLIELAVVLTRTSLLIELAVYCSHICPDLRFNFSYITFQPSSYFAQNVRNGD